MGVRPAAGLLTPAFVALTVADLAYFSATGILLVATPLLATGPLGSSEAGVGLAMGAFSATTLLLRPLAGRWSDARGRRPLLVGGAALFAVLVLGHYIVTSLAALVALRLLLGAAEAFFFVAGFAALADLAPAGRAGEALSLNSLALYAGLAGGPVLGQLLLRAGGFPAAWAGAAALAAGAVLLALRVPETRTGPVPVGTGPARAPAPMIHRAALVPGLALLTGVAATSGFLAFAVLHAQNVGISAWSSVHMLFGATVVTCRVAFARLPDRVPPIPLAAAALAVCAAGFLLLGGLRTPAGALAGALAVGVGTAFLTPAVFAAVFSAVPASQRGSAAATTSVFIDLGLSGGPVLLGALTTSWALGTAFLLMTAVPTLGAALLMSSRPRQGRPVAA